MDVLRSSLQSGPESAKARQINLWSVASLGIGAMVGAGIFAILGQTAVLAGKQTYVSFILGGLIAALCGYSYAKLSCRYPDAGGISTYFDEAFGAGRLSGTLSLIYLITIAVTVALVAKAFGAYAVALLWSNANRIWIDAFASALVIVLALLNMTGAGLVGKAEVVLVGLKLFILAGLMVVGATNMGHVPAGAMSGSTLTGIVGGVGLTFLAYAGFGMMANAAGSVPNPQRTIPRAIYLAIGAVIVLYVGLAIVVVGNVSPAELATHSDTAVAEAARPVLGRAGYTIVAVAALLATASGVNAWIFSAMNISVNLVNAGQLPRMFSKSVWRKGTVRHLRVIGLAASIDGASSLVEGWALYRRFWWSGWLIVCTTSAAIPLEVIAVIRHPSAIRITLLVANALIVVYLLRRRAAVTASRAAWFGPMIRVTTQVLFGSPATPCGACW